MIRLFPSLLALWILMLNPLMAENPFAGSDPKPTDSGDFEQGGDAPIDDGIENFGFEPPSGAVPPPTRPAAAPNQKPASAQAPSRRNPSPTAKAPPQVSPSNKASGANQKPAPKLADYLELDSSVKGLQVKNFDFPERDIRDVVTMVSKWTGKNFILDNKVRGKITILGPSEVTLQEAYHAFLSALNANNLTTVQSGKFIRIIESAEARRAPVPTYAGEYAPDNDSFITRIFQLNYINADEVERQFRDLTTRQGRLLAYAPTNSIIITDTGSNIKRIQDILQNLDVKGFETSLHVLRVEHTSAKQIAEMLDQIYGDSGTTSRTSSSARTNSRSFRRTALERTRGGGIISKIIPDEQTNSLIVLANEAGFEKLLELVGKLDIKTTDTGRIHVYYCEYAKAEDLSQTLASLSGSNSSSPSTSRTGSRTSRPTARNARTTQTSSRNSITAELEGGIKITADPPTNALVITASSSDYQTLKRVIKKLDIPRLQVFVESAILEITVDDTFDKQFNYGAGANNLPFVGGYLGAANRLTSFFGQISDPSQLGNLGGTTIPILAGARKTITLGNQQVEIRSFNGLLSLIQRNSNTTILSTPQIIALDNEEAVFKVQDNIPVQSGSNATANGSITNSIEKEKVGIEIKLTPNVNAVSRSIRLDIEQRVDSVKPSAVPEGLRASNIATTSRETNTKVVVKDQDFVMMSGLMTDQYDIVEDKIPILGDIPILGWLFSSESKKKTKKNLVILLHPRIIGTTLDSALLIEDKLNRREKFIKKNLQVDDLHYDQVKEFRDGLKEQKDRGSKEIPVDYRNNDDEETTTDNRPVEKDLKKEEPKKDEVASKPTSQSQSNAPSPAEQTSLNLSDDLEDALMVPDLDDASTQTKTATAPAPNLMGDKAQDAGPFGLPKGEGLDGPDDGLLIPSDPELGNDELPFLDNE